MVLGPSRQTPNIYFGSGDVRLYTRIIYIKKKIMLVILVRMHAFFTDKLFVKFWLFVFLSMNASIWEVM